MNKPVMIMGGPNSGTSSLVAMLNAHSRALVLFETDLNSLHPGKYAKRLLSSFPDLRSMMYEHDLPASAYLKLREAAASLGYKYSIVGDKLPDFSKSAFERFADFKVIYSFRNPDQWLAKVAGSYSAEADVRPLLLQYCAGLFNTCHHGDCLVVPFKDFMAENRSTVAKVFDFIGLEPEPQCFQWWKSVGHYNDPFKNAQYWWKGHASSMTEPRRNDTTVQRKDNPLWQIIDEAFDCALSMAQNRGKPYDTPASLLRLATEFGDRPLPITALMDYRVRRVGFRHRLKMKLKYALGA